MEYEQSPRVQAWAICDSFVLVAAMNPCPCGYYGDNEKPCTCTTALVSKYQKRISGPLLDRIDIHLEVPRVPIAKLAALDTGEASSEERIRVLHPTEVLKYRSRSTFLTWRVPCR